MKIKIFYLGGLLGFPNIFKIGVSLNTGKRKSQLSNGVRFIMFYEIALGKIILNGRLEYLADIIEKRLVNLVKVMLSITNMTGSV